MAVVRAGRGSRRRTVQGVAAVGAALLAAAGLAGTASAGTASAGTTAAGAAAAGTAPTGDQAQHAGHAARTDRAHQDSGHLPGLPGSDTFTNPVTQGYSIDFPDPAVIRAKDGHWYAYATGGPYDQSGRGDSYKIAESDDLTHWREVGSVFNEANRPDWAAPTSGFWAPDIRYLNGQYLLYFTVPDTKTAKGGGDPAIGVATAPTPAGPWRPSDEPLIPARPNGDGGYYSTIDPAMFTDTDGTHYLYFGGFGGGLWVTKLTADGEHTVGEPRQVASASRFEGAYVIHRGDWYYLLASSGGCCNGPTTGYTVFAGRSKSPTGPFVDKLGNPLLGSRPGGTPVIAPNGNRWVGTGHNSLVTDATGQQWMTYHAIDRNDPWLHSSPGFTMRPMNLDRLDWVDGWPTVRGGKGASDSPQAAPVTKGFVDDRFEEPAHTARTFHAVRGTLSVEPPDSRSDSGGFARLGGARTLALARGIAPADTRIEADVRPSDDGSAGLVTRYLGHRHQVRAAVDASAGVLRVKARAGRHVRTRTAPLPAGYDASAWHTLAVETRGRQVSVQLTDARLGDPWATVFMKLPGRISLPGKAGLLATGGGDVDNVSVARLFTPHSSVAPPPELGTLDPAYSDGFGDGLGSGWSWIRKDPNATVEDGRLQWPTQDGDIVGDGPAPGVLVRDAPDGDYAIQAKVNVDFGDDTVRNFQQGGLIIYSGDDEFLRYDLVANGPIRMTEFGKETVYEGLRSWGAGMVGAVAPDGQDTWMRIVHTTDPDTGEHRYRAASSVDGKHWVWGLTWTMPADSDPKIGLVSHGSNPDLDQSVGRALTTFDYVHVYRPEGK